MYYMKVGATFLTGQIDGGTIWSNSCTTSCGGGALFGSSNVNTYWIEGGTVVELGFLSSYNTSCSNVYLTGIEFNVEPE